MLFVQSAKLQDVKASCCSLVDACLIDAHIDGIDLKGADVSGATYDVEQLVATGVLEGAVVGAVNWCNKSLQNAKLHSVMLSLALSLTLCLGLVQIGRSKLSL